MTQLSLFPRSVRVLQADPRLIKGDLYAAEAGQFQQAGFATAICGPGSIDQAHQANEFITLKQVEAGTQFVRRLIERLAQ